MVAVIAQTVGAATEVGGRVSTAVHPLTLIAHLIHIYKGLNFEQFRCVSTGCLEKSVLRIDSSPVAYDGAECDLPSPFGVVNIRVAIYRSMADVAVSGVENFSQFKGLPLTWHSSNENGLAWVNRFGVVHGVVTVREIPGTDLHLSVIVWVAGDKHEEFALLYEAALDQLVNCNLLFEHYKRKSIRGKIRFRFSFVWPVDSQLSKSNEMVLDLGFAHQWKSSYKHFARVGFEGIPRGYRGRRRVDSRFKGIPGGDRAEIAGCNSEESWRVEAAGQATVVLRETRGFCGGFCGGNLWFKCPATTYKTSPNALIRPIVARSAVG